MSSFCFSDYREGRGMPDRIEKKNSLSEQNKNKQKERKPHALDNHRQFF
jgi:hypothetical protein